MVGLTAEYSDLVAADFNRDGRLDLIVVKGTANEISAGSGVYVLIGQGDGTFTSPVLYEAGLPYRAVSAADRPATRLTI